MSAQPGPFDLAQSFNEALALHRQGRLRDADKIYTRVLKAAPDHFDALNLLGTVKMQLGRIGEAHRLLTAAVKINPRAPGGWVNLGHVLHALKRDQEALDCLEKARALAPGDVEILNDHANALLSAGRAQEALAEFRQVLAQVPHHADALINSGIAQAALGAPDHAVAAFDRALSIAPGHPAANYNRGIALFNLGRHADAVEAHDNTLAASPQHAGAWFNRGQALAALNRLDEAVDCYGKVTAIRKDHADAHFNEALALLTLGDYRRGFEKYEWRWRRSEMPPQRGRGRPLWLGDYPLARKTVLLHAEQGLGDTIQFVRYVPLLVETGAKVVLEVQPELMTLMARLNGPAAVIPRGDKPPAFDVHCPLSSLPLAFKTEPDTVPAQVPYLSADEAHLAKWSARIGALARPRIAIAWSGNASHVNDRNRSIAFARLAPLFPPPNPAPPAGQENSANPSPHAGQENSANPPPPAGEGRVGARFLSIQRDVRSADAEVLAGESRVTHVGGELENFADTAAVVALADLVITVDSAVAHLAGAMGRPVWVLLPFAPDWRWTLEGETTPWYPTARLFRQTSLGDWDDVIARVAVELKRFTPQ